MLRTVLSDFCVAKWHDVAPHRTLLGPVLPGPAPVVARGSTQASILHENVSCMEDCILHGGVYAARGVYAGRSSV